MAKEFFKRVNFRNDSLVTIAQAIEIIEEYEGQGFVLTLRQLYYQLVARDLLPNTQRAYKRLGGLISNARLAGYIDWDSIEDRTRNLESLPYWSSPEHILSGVAAQYRENRWRDQPYEVEVWIEKEALVGVIARICEKYRVPYFACRGYVSQSEQYHAGKRFEEAIDNDKRVLLLHLGDHDPSGIDMTRDNEERLEMFAHAWLGNDFTVRRLALNMDQVEEYDPPPNPAKFSDSRFRTYVSDYGYESWELDALEPQVLETLIGDAIEEVIDWDAWNKAEVKEQEERATFRKLQKNFRAAKAWLAEEFK